MIRCRLAYLLLDREMTLTELSEATGIALNNLSILKTNRAKAVRFTTLNRICEALSCSPGELIEYVPDEEGGDKQGAEADEEDGPPRETEPIRQAG